VSPAVPFDSGETLIGSGSPARPFPLLGPLFGWIQDCRHRTCGVSTPPLRPATSAPGLAAATATLDAEVCSRKHATAASACDAPMIVERTSASADGNADNDEHAPTFAQVRAL
jgi:hypothetical protein